MKLTLRAAEQVEYRHLPMPTKIQMHSVVKGDDRYQARRKSNLWFALLLFTVGLVAIITALTK